MKNNIFLFGAFSILTQDERKLIKLLMCNNVTKEKIVLFLCDYDIENEPASITYLINYLLDRCDIEVAENAKIPRIRGLRDYYRFYNTKVLMNISPNKPIVDIDLSLRVKYQDDVRPLTSYDKFIDEIEFKKVYSEKFYNTIFLNLKTVRCNDKKYIVPDDKSLLDILYLALCRAIKQKNSIKIACYICDIYRYFNNKMPSGKFFVLFINKCVKLVNRTMKKWLSKQKN